MMDEKTMVLPANYAAMSEDEMVYTAGGATAEQIVRGTAAVGGALVLTYVGGSILKGLGGLLGDNIIGNFIGGVGSIATGIIGGGVNLVVSGIGAVLGGVANAVDAIL